MRKGQLIEDLEYRAENLQVKVSEFNRQTKRLKCKMCQENLKACVCLTVVIAVSKLIEKVFFFFNQ